MSNRYDGRRLSGRPNARPASFNDGRGRGWTGRRLGRVACAGCLRVGYTVFVGWNDQLGSFYAEVYQSNPGDLVLQVGGTALEIPTISKLQEATLRYISLDPATVTALRHDAIALADRPHNLPHNPPAHDPGGL